jgi:16S rRNA processing protein RimM
MPPLLLQQKPQKKPQHRLKPRLNKSMKDNSSARVAVGVFGAPHGVRGEIKIKSYTGDPLAIADYAPLTDQTGQRRFILKKARSLKDDLLIVTVEGVTDRDAAAKLTNLELFASRDLLPEAEEDEFYHVDLIGLKAIDEHNADIGTVLALHNFGAGDIIEIKPHAGGPSLMLPFTKKTVPSVKIGKGSLTLVMPEEIAGEEREEEDKA